MANVEISRNSSGGKTGLFPGDLLDPSQRWFTLPHFPKELKQGFTSIFVDLFVKKRDEKTFFNLKNLKQATPALNKD